MSYIYPNQPLNYYFDSENPIQTNSPVRISSVSKVKDNQFHFLRITPGLYDEDNVSFFYNSLPYELFNQTLDRIVNDNAISLRLDNTLDSLNEIFPISVRFITQDNSYIVERPPFRTTIRFTPVRASRARLAKNIHEVDVWVPWTVYKIQYFKNGAFTFRMFINHSPISSFEDRIYVPPFANLFQDCSICFGSDQYYINDQINKLIQSGSVDLKSIFSTIIGTYFNGGWNADVLPARYNMPSFFYPDANLKDNKAQAIYNTAFSKITPSKTRYTAIRDYIDLLNVWSNYSLDDLLYLYSNEYSHDSTSSRSSTTVKDLCLPNVRAYHSSDKIDYFKQLSSQNNFNILDLMKNGFADDDDFYGANKDLVKSINFTADPLTNCSVSTKTMLSQEYLYKILDHLIETQLTPTSGWQPPFIVDPFSVYEEEPF